MILIDKEKLINDFWAEVRNPHNHLSAYAYNFYLADIIEKQEAVLETNGTQVYGAVLAPCPRCGSFEVEITTKQEKDNIEHIPYFRGVFHCIVCDRRWTVRAPDMRLIYKEWNKMANNELTTRVAKSSGK